MRCGNDMPDCDSGGDRRNDSGGDRRNGRAGTPYSYGDTRPNDTPTNGAHLDAKPTNGAHVDANAGFYKPNTHTEGQDFHASHEFCPT